VHDPGQTNPRISPVRGLAMRLAGRRPTLWRERLPPARAKKSQQLGGPNSGPRLPPFTLPFSLACPRAVRGPACKPPLDAKKDRAALARLRRAALSVVVRRRDQKKFTTLLLFFLAPFWDLFAAFFGHSNVPKNWRT